MKAKLHSAIARGLKKIDSKYAFESGEYFIYDNELYGQVEINRAGHSFFADDINRFKHYVAEHSHQPNAEKVLSMLEAATAEFFAKVIWEDRQDTETLAIYEPLWEWFFANREGLLYVDGNGFL